MAMWRIQYSVQGRMGFPMDMLRYDSSFPYSSEDVAKIEDSEPYKHSEMQDALQVAFKVLQQRVETPGGIMPESWVVAAYQKAKDALDGKGREVLTVRLVHYADTKHWTPTNLRWQSFLWSVVPDSIGVSKVG